jgi:hypothetical protein
MLRTPRHRNPLQLDALSNRLAGALQLGLCQGQVLLLGLQRLGLVLLDAPEQFEDLVVF